MVLQKKQQREFVTLKFVKEKNNFLYTFFRLTWFYIGKMLSICVVYAMSSHDNFSPLVKGLRNNLMVKDSFVWGCAEDF